MVKDTKWLSNVITDNRPSRGLKGVVYGPPGVGKTSTLASIPNVLFGVCAGEDSLGVLIEAKQCPAVASFPAFTSFADVNEAVDELIASDKLPGTFVFDSLFHLEHFIIDDVTETKFQGNKKEFDSYGRGYIHVTDSIRLLLSKLDTLVERGMNMILIAHAEAKRQNCPETTDYDRLQFAAHKRIYGQIHAWADTVLMMSYHVHVKEEKTGRAKATGLGERRLFTSPVPARDCKNRFGLDAEYNLGNSPVDGAKVLQEILPL